MQATTVTFKEQKEPYKPKLTRSTTYYSIKELKVKPQKAINEEKTDRVYHGQITHDPSTTK